MFLQKTYCVNPPFSKGKKKENVYKTDRSGFVCRSTLGPRGVNLDLLFLPRRLRRTWIDLRGQVTRPTRPGLLLTKLYSGITQNTRHRSL